MLQLSMVQIYRKRFDYQRKLVKKSLIIKSLYVHTNHFEQLKRFGVSLFGAITLTLFIL